VIRNHSTNTNPLGPPAWASDVLTDAAAVLSRYPELWHTTLERQIAELIGINAEKLVVIPASSLVVSALPWLIGELRSPTGWLDPTFWEYSLVAKRERLPAFPFPILDAAGGCEAPIAVDQVISHIRNNGIRVFVLVRPNNPTAHTLTLDEIDALVASAPNCMFVLDETYEFFEPSWESTVTHWRSRPANSISLVSLSKAACLPGLRIGLALFGDEALALQVRERLGPVRINTLAALILPRFLSDREYLQRTRRFLRSEWRKIEQGLTGLEHRLVIERRTEMFAIGRVRLDVARGGALVQQQLETDHDIRVLDCSVYGMPNHIRFKLLGTKENAAFLRALHLLSGSRHFADSGEEDARVDYEAMTSADHPGPSP
jgi:threonine-phosphate decarboxylase